MGGTSGHVSLGIAFFLIGLWHLFNCIKLHALHPTSYKTLPWFPVSRFRYVEPVMIIFVTTIFVSMELFVGKTPLSPDGTIPSNELRHFEHSIIAISFLIYAFFAILVDKVNPPAKHGLIHFLQAAAFTQQLLILHLHSTDHMGVEGQYHYLLQIVTFVSLVTTVLAIGHAESFLNSFVRAFSVIFEGVWLVVMGVMLWTPRLLPKGCFLKVEMGRDAVLCNGERALERAKALVNIQFGWYLIGLTVFSMSFYLVVVKMYAKERVEYETLVKCEEEEKSALCQTRNGYQV